MSSLISILSIIFLIPSLFAQKCQINQNLCARCNIYTDLCEECLTDLAKPDNSGGCGPIRKCSPGKNYCDECDEKGEICDYCEKGFFADINGGCSYTEYCDISDNGVCLKCDKDFYLIGNSQFSFCKYKALFDFMYCEKINFGTGKCEICENPFQLSVSDGKCVETKNCAQSTYGVCDKCLAGYYLDKTDDKCKKYDEKFYNCLISLDGETCNQCIKGYYLSEDKLCSLSNNCLKTKLGSDCLKCKDDYYLSRDNTCTTERRCAKGNKETGKCESCENDYYLDIETGKCKSYQNNEFKYCAIANSDKCLACIMNYYLGEDSKCSSSQHCVESENGECIECEEDYHLGDDNKCFNIENCLRFDFKGCSQCKESYYYDTITEKCLPENSFFSNCARAYGWYCQECKDGYYLNSVDKKCYSNEKEGNFYKCKNTDFYALMCLECEEGYYLGTTDYKCSKIKGCAVSGENENECVKCDDNYCMNVKTGKCLNNYQSPKSEEEAFYYACNSTNEEGTECEECKNDKYSIEDGICVNREDCVDDECTKCAKIDDKGRPMCLNDVLGCVRTRQYNCLKCDNILNLDACTECVKGYELNNKNECV